MKIEIPEGYTLPEDIADGETLEELVTFRVEGEYLVPTMIAGVEIAAEEAEDEADTMEEEATAEMEANASPMRGMGERIMGMA
jgi:mannose/fructose/N-acetylgalactosamine-specific phosphotransferase system component IID